MSGYSSWRDSIGLTLSITIWSVNPWITTGRNIDHGAVAIHRNLFGGVGVVVGKHNGITVNLI